MSAKKWNVAMVGLGFGAEFMPIYQNHPLGNIYAICQRNKEKLNKIGDTFKIEKRFTSYEDVLKDPNVDFVHINSPIPDHAPMSIAALKAGKHVMCTVHERANQPGAGGRSVSFHGGQDYPCKARGKRGGGPHYGD